MSPAAVMMGALRVTCWIITHLFYIQTFTLPSQTLACTIYQEHIEKQKIPFMQDCLFKSFQILNLGKLKLKMLL